MKRSLDEIRRNADEAHLTGSLGKTSYSLLFDVPALCEEVLRLQNALLLTRGYAVEIERDSIMSVQSMRASLIQEVVDRALGLYPPDPEQRAGDAEGEATDGE